MRKRIDFLRYALVFALCLAVVIVFAANGEAAEFKKEYKMQINVGSHILLGDGSSKIFRFGERANQRPDKHQTLLEQYPVERGPVEISPAGRQRGDRLCHGIDHQHIARHRRSQHLLPAVFHQQF